MSNKTYIQIIKELAKQEKEVRQACTSLNITVKSPTQTLNDDQCKQLFAYFGKTMSSEKGSSQANASTSTELQSSTEAKVKKPSTPVIPVAPVKSTDVKKEVPAAETKPKTVKKPEESTAKILQPPKVLESAQQSTLIPKDSIKTDVKAKAEPKTEAKVEPKTEAKVEPKTEAKVIKKTENTAKIISRPSEVKSDAVIVQPKAKEESKSTPIDAAVKQEAKEEMVILSTPVVEEPKVIKIVVDQHQPTPAVVKKTAATPASAKILGSIPLDQLKSRTNRPTTGGGYHQRSQGGHSNQNGNQQGQYNRFAPRNQERHDNNQGQSQGYQGQHQNQGGYQGNHQNQGQNQGYQGQNQGYQGQRNYRSGQGNERSFNPDQQSRGPRSQESRSFSNSPVSDRPPLERKDFAKNTTTQLNNSFKSERPAYSAQSFDKQGGSDRPRSQEGSFSSDRSGGYQNRSSSDQPRRDGASTGTRSPRSMMMQLSVPAPSTEPSRGDRRKTKLAHQDDDQDKKGIKKTSTDDPDVLLRNRVKKKLKVRKGAKNILTTPAAHKRIVRIDNTITVGELGRVMGVKANDIIVRLMNLGVTATINQVLDFDTASLVANEFNYEAKNISFDEKTLLATVAKSENSVQDPDAILRAPVVTIMGHVDHGKTTLLDRIRSANVAKGEAGGITQHIGAYRVETKNGPVVFLDTPGHAAFSAMRARGASVTDLIVLVVAADDGIMPQTIESIKHAQAAKVPIIVAVNKIDKPNIDPDRIRQELTQYNIVPEEWGGDNMFVNISGLTGLGVNELLDSLALQAEVLELRANPKKQAYGRVIEARIDKGRGAIVTVLVQEGTLKVGDYMLVGQHHGKVRSMTDHLGKATKSAGPSTPVEVSGLNGVPSAGEEFYLVKSEKDAKTIVSSREQKAKELVNIKQPAVLGADPFKKEEKQTQYVMLKTDVSGSLEAIKLALESILNDEVQVKIMGSGVGQITESDVMLAMTANAKIIGFNVGPDSNAKKLIEQHNVSCLRYSIIYELIDAVKDMLSGLLAPEVIEENTGKAQVRMVFNIQKIGVVAGCMVTEGKIARSNHARVIREGKQIHEGKLSALKRFKDDVKEVSAGFECGISIDGYKDIKEGDILTFVEYKEIRRKVD